MKRKGQELLWERRGNIPVEEYFQEIACHSMQLTACRRLEEESDTE